MIRQDFDNLPPKMFLMQIIDSITKIYLFLWDKKDDEFKLYIDWKEISKMYHRNAFRTGLRKLCNEGLLNYKESDDGVSVELVGWDELMAD